MTTRARVAAAAFLAVLGACNMGTRHETYPSARTGLGATFKVALLGNSPQGRGELLAVRDSSVLALMQNGRFAEIPYARVRMMQFDHLDEHYWMANTMSAENLGLWRTRARQVARYPQGLAPEQLAQLMASRQQPAPDTLR